MDGETGAIINDKETKVKSPEKLKQMKTSIDSFKLMELRQNTLQKDNFNFFVGDVEYKKDWLLQFLSAQTQSNYEKHLY